MSWRWASRLTGRLQMISRHQAVWLDYPALLERLKGLASVGRRFGCRLLRMSSQCDGYEVNHERKFITYREGKLRVQRRLGRRHAIGSWPQIDLLTMPHQNWSLSFASDKMTDRRRFCIIAMVGDCAQKFLPSITEGLLSAVRVVNQPVALLDASCKAQTFVGDSGTELAVNAILKLLADNRSEWHYIASRKPNHQYSFIESCRDRLRDEFLNAVLLPPLRNARNTVAVLPQNYHTSDVTSASAGSLQTSLPRLSLRKSGLDAAQRAKVGPSR